MVVIEVGRQISDASYSIIFPEFSLSSDKFYTKFLLLLKS